MSRPIPEPGTSRWGSTSHKDSTWNTNATVMVFWCVTPCRPLEIHYSSGKITGSIFRKECYVSADISPLWMYLAINILRMKHDLRWTAAVASLYICSLPYASECTRSTAVHLRTYKHEAAALSVLNQSVFWFIVKMSLRCWNVLKEEPGLKNT